MTQKLADNERCFDRWASSYDFPLFQFWMRRFYQPALSSITTGKVLDVSCGTGEFLRELLRKRKVKLYGIDYSAKMVALARAKLGKGVSLQKADVHRLPFPDNTFDYVISTEAFHHYYDQSRALSEMKRVAKGGATIMVADINFFLPVVHYLFERFEPGCVKVQSKSEIRDLFCRVGLKKVTQKRSFLFAVLTQGIKHG